MKVDPVRSGQFQEEAALAHVDLAEKDTGSNSSTTQPPPATTERRKREDNNMVKASFLSRLFFAWVYPLLRLGMQRPLEELDLPEVAHVDSSPYNRDYLAQLWENEKKQNPSAPSLQRALAKDFFKSTWFVQPMFAANCASRVTQAAALGYLIEYFGGRNQNGYMWATVIVVCALVLLFEHHHCFFFTWRKGMQLRIAAVASIYDKSIRLSATHHNTVSSYGRIMNLASNDVERFLMATLFVNHLFWAPVESIAILVVGCLILGPAFAVGLAVLLLVFIPLQFYLSKRFAYYRSRIAAITDQRVTFVSQAIRGVRVMKMSGYEHRFLDRIQHFRRLEMAEISRANRLKAINEMLFFVTNVVISLIIFIAHVSLGGHLSPGAVYAVFTLINVLQLDLTKHVSMGVMGVSEWYVSAGRLQKFLEFPELPPRSPTLASLPDSGSMKSRSDSSNEPNRLNDEMVVISMTHVKCYWNMVLRMRRVTIDSEPPSKDSTSTDGSTDDAPLILALDDISIDFTRGELTAIIGTVGSGKSALLQAIVQELPVAAGKVVHNYHTIAYAAQDPWIMDGTVRENILLGLPYNESWYNSVINACGLVVDFNQLRDGDQTVVGDRGVQCSGGQRARIGLARAIYRDADVLVVDDPLSAVDARVGRQLFHEALLGLATGRGKCVILATHQHQYVNECRCVLMTTGRIKCIGSYDECVKASDGKLVAHAADDTVDALDEHDSNRQQHQYQDKPSIKGIVVHVDAGMETEKDTPDDKDDNKEISARGVVRGETYLNYFRAMGGIWVGVCLLVLYAVTQTSVLMTVASFGRWARTTPSDQRKWLIMGPAVGLTALVVALGFIRASLSFELTIRASQRLHDKMAKAVLRTRVEFFDTNPLGRIINRFSADVGSNDDQLPPTLYDASSIAFVVLGALVTTVVVLPFTLVAVPPLLWYFVTVRRTFVTSTRELKRLEGLARSPIYAMMSESLGGIATIRANNSIPYFRRMFWEAHDAHTRAFFSFIAASRWLGFRMEAIMFLFLTVVCYLSVLCHEQGWLDVDPSILGLSVSMLLQLTGIFQWCVRQSAEVVNQMVSVERVLAFGELKSEAPLELPGDTALLKDKNWPQNASIEFQDLSVRYRSSLPLVLDQVSFSIPAGSRVGIVGRTGSGKSTIVQTLFRLLESDHGRILIDGVDISSLGLHALRTRMSVIPQSPTLFSGCTIRENLDLFGLHPDSAIEQVLEQCHLSAAVSELPLGIHSPVAENGSNFSVGQRQLLCLARAILNKSKILVLDEATASVDRRTDQFLHEALHKSFGLDSKISNEVKENEDGMHQHDQHGATILAVAHRLDTVIEHDFILVLGHGKVLEFDTPANLIRLSGAFASMVMDTGEAMSSELKQRAFHHEELKQKKKQQ